MRLDPKFALAWALLSYVDARGYHTTNLPPTVALRKEARQAFETALALDLNLGEAWVAQGYYHYGCVNDILERRPAEIISRLKELLAKPDPDVGYLSGELRFWLGWAQEIAGDHTELLRRTEAAQCLQGCGCIYG